MAMTMTTSSTLSRRSSKRASSTTIESAVSKAAVRFIASAKIAGMSRQALELCLTAGYIPQPKQLEFHAACLECDKPDGPDQVGFGGARGPGKSHAMVAQAAIIDCQRIPGLKVLYLRKIAKNAREQFDDLRRSVLRKVPHESKAGMIVFPNDSRIMTGHFRNESDIDSYLGLEYDIIVIEEATTLTQSKYRALRDSNRSSKPGFRPRMYCSTNPGGFGHACFKERFIRPARNGDETETRFIFATVTDNKYIDPDYIRKLEDNTGWRLKAYRFGDWDIAAGQFFTTFRHDLHVIDVKDRFTELPSNAVYWASLDYGFTHYTVAHLFMRHDGITYVLDEFAARKELVSHNAEQIKAMLGRHKLRIGDLKTIAAGHDCFAARGAANGETIADQYNRAGLFLRRADNDRIAGAGHILSMLGDAERGLLPKLYIDRKCSRLVECLPIMAHDEKRPEDVKKIDADEDGNGGDDAYDSLRYGVMANPTVGAWI